MSTLAVWISLFWFFPFTPIFKQNHLKSFAITLTVTDSLLAVWPIHTFPTTEHAWRLECHGRLLKMFACIWLNSCPGWQDCSVRKMGSENWGAHLLELKFRLAWSCQLSLDLFQLGALFTWRYEPVSGTGEARYSRHQQSELFDMIIPQFFLKRIFFPLAFPTWKHICQSRSW